MLRRVGSALPIALVLLSLIIFPQQTILAANFSAGTEAALNAAISSADASAGPHTIFLTANITLTAVSATDPVTQAAFGDTGLPPITSNITIEGQGFTISRSGAAPNFRILRVDVDGTLTLHNITVSGGAATEGTGCVNSTRACGGGIFNSGTLVMMNTLISNNAANLNNNVGDLGGGIASIGSSTLTITDSTISNNSTSGGGAGIYSLGSATVNSTVFSNNSAAGNGGGFIQDTNGTTSTITDSTFSGNSVTSAASAGGGIWNIGDLMISDSTFTGNTAVSNGGAIYTEPSSITTIANSTLSGNTSPLGAGISNSNFGTITITNSTIAANGSGFAGGILNNGTATIQNTIITKGLATNTCVNNSTMTATFSQNDDGSCTTAGFTQSSTLNLDTLKDNGGPTQTIDLLTGSSAMDAADSSFCFSAPVSFLDQRGVQRGFDGDGVVNSPQAGDCDMGALEATAVLPTVEFAAPASIVTAGSGVSPVTLTLSFTLPANFAPVQVYIRVSGGTAIAGTDYAPFGVQTATISPTHQTATVNLNLTNAQATSARTLTLSIATQNGPGFDGPVSLGTQLTHQVTIIPPSAPAATPEINFYDSTHTPTLTWNPVTDAVQYEIQVDTDTKFLPSFILDTTVSGSVLFLTLPSVPNPPFPLANGTYYWRVRAYTSKTVGSWSAIQSFKILAP